MIGWIVSVGAIKEREEHCLVTLSLPIPVSNVILITGLVVCDKLW